MKTSGMVVSKREEGRLQISEGYDLKNRSGTEGEVRTRRMVAGDEKTTGRNELVTTESIRTKGISRQKREVYWYL